MCGFLFTNRSEMKLTVLTENTASPDFLAEFGLSYLLEHDDMKILFDTGSTDVFKKNAGKLDIDLQTVDMIVLSHGHWDHGNGLKYLKNKPLLCHPGVFIRRYHKNDDVHIGLELSREELEQRFQIILSGTPYKISDKIIFLGEIPRRNAFESKSTAFMDEHGKEDYIPDDSALTMVVNDELVVVSGCAHSGICNIIEYARDVTGVKKVNTVIGGFHLKSDDRQTKETIQYLKDLQIAKVLPSHCTQLPALAAFYREFQMEQVRAGMVFHF